jgi:hypothetical protein
MRYLSPSPGGSIGFSECSSPADDDEHEELEDESVSESSLVILVFEYINPDLIKSGQVTPEEQQVHLPGPWGIRCPA